MNQAIDITTNQRKAILVLLGKYLPNTTAWVYGSRVKWTSRQQSDLDMVVFATPEQHRMVSNLKEAFEESNLPFRVDLFLWDEIPEKFHKEIEGEHVVLVERKKAPKQKTVGDWPKVPLGNCANLIRESVSPSAMGNAIYIGLEHIGEGTLSLIGRGVATDVISNQIEVQMW